MRNNPVGWFEIYVRDMSRAKSFYEKVFLGKLTRMEVAAAENIEMWLFPRDAGAGAPGALIKMPGFDSGANSTIVYFECDDCAVEESRVKSAAGRVHKPKWSIGEHGFISLVVDTEGNMLGLHSPK
jgi:uncharacterized protein